MAPGATEPTPAMIVLRLGKLIAMALARHDLTEHQFRALAFVRDGDPSLAEMSLRLVMKRPNLTTLIDGLEERGLVVRRRRADDRRRVELALTPAGLSTFLAASEEADRALAGLALLGDGDPGRRIDALRSWATTVDAAAAILSSEIRSDARPRALERGAIP